MVFLSAPSPFLTWMGGVNFVTEYYLNYAAYHY